MIYCQKCEHFTHFSCTQLPGYQLAQLMTKGYRKYICAACYGDVHSDYIDSHHMTGMLNIETQTLWTAWATLKRALKSLSEESLRRLGEKVEGWKRCDAMKAENDSLAEKLDAAKIKLVNDCLTTQKKTYWKPIDEHLKSEKAENITLILKRNAIEGENETICWKVRRRLLTT